MKNIILAQINGSKAVVDKCEKANTILDKDNNYKELKNTLVVSEINTKLSNAINSITSKDNSVDIVRINDSVDLSVDIKTGVQEITCFDGSVFIDSIVKERPNITIANYEFVSWPKNQWFISPSDFPKFSITSDNIKVDVTTGSDFGKITLDSFDQSNLFAFGTIELNFSSCFLLVTSEEPRAYNFEILNSIAIFRNFIENLIARYGGGKVQNLIITSVISSNSSNFPQEWGSMSKVNSNAGFVKSNLRFEVMNNNEKVTMYESETFSAAIKLSFWAEVRR